MSSRCDLLHFSRSCEEKWKRTFQEGDGETLFVWTVRPRERSPGPAAPPARDVLSMTALDQSHTAPGRGPNRRDLKRGGAKTGGILKGAGPRQVGWEKGWGRNWQNIKWAGLKWAGLKEAGLHRLT